jgi:hypothetical protein
MHAGEEGMMMLIAYILTKMHRYSFIIISTQRI